MNTDWRGFSAVAMEQKKWSCLEGFIWIDLKVARHMCKFQEKVRYFLEIRILSLERLFSCLFYSMSNHCLRINDLMWNIIMIRFCETCCLKNQLVLSFVSSLVISLKFDTYSQSNDEMLYAIARIQPSYLCLIPR